LAERILLLRPGAIGDALLTFPALAALRQAQPGAKLALCAHPAVRELALEHGLADEFFSRDGPEIDALFSTDPELARNRLGRLSAAVIWSAAEQSQLSDNLRALGASPLIQAPSQPPAASGLHLTQHLTGTLRPLGVFSEHCGWPGLSPERRRREHPEQAVPAPIVLHPGSGSRQKNWPPERFAQLGLQLERLLPGRLTVLVGPAEEDLLPRLHRALGVPYRRLENPPLLDLADLLANAALYVGNDSGISHLAGLSGAPTLALFGPTDPALWRPFGKRVQVIRHEPLEALPVETVWNLAASMLAVDRR
jgi:heptosyltransferase III